MDEYKMAGTNMSNAQTLLNQIFGAWKKDYFEDYSDSAAFEIFASELALRTYGLALDEVESGLVGGGQDGGIDAVYVLFDDIVLDEDSEIVSESSRPGEFSQDRTLELWIVQAKRSPSFEEIAVDKLESTIRRLLELGQTIESLAVLYNEALLAHINVFRMAWTKLLTRRPKISINVVYATLGQSRGITPQMEAKLNALDQTIRNALPDNSRVNVELLGDRELLARYNERPSYTLTMNYQESATSGKSHVALVRLSDYYDLIVDENGRLRRHLFEWNVRDYQGNVSVNKEIRASLAQEESPEFWWLNNGITILCSEASSAGKTYSLSNIQIVNGLQTSHTVYDYLKGQPSPEKDQRMLLVRIIVTADTAIRDQVIRATNRQTAVTDASLRATDEVQRNIETFYLTKGWYYDRRKNFYKNEGKDASKIIGIPLLGAALTAMGLSRPDKARGKPSSLLKVDEDYKSVFAPGVDLEIYFWVAKMQRRVDAFLYSDLAEATPPQRNNLKFHLSMLAVAKLLGTQGRAPQQLKALAREKVEVSDDSLKRTFDDLRTWSEEYVSNEATPLDTATKSQRFTDYLLGKAGLAASDK
jgi:hypothetical protein